MNLSLEILEKLIHMDNQAINYSLPFLTLKIVILPSLDILKREMHDTTDCLIPEVYQFYE